LRVEDRETADLRVDNPETANLQARTRKNAGLTLNKNSRRRERETRADAPAPDQQFAEGDNILSSFPIESQGKWAPVQPEISVGIEINCKAIRGPNFVLPFAGIDAAADAAGMEVTKARKLTEGIAATWSANGIKPDDPLAMLTAALQAHASGGKAKKGSAKKRPGKTTGDQTDVDLAFDLYNGAAKQHGFASSHLLTEERRKLLAKRLADIGGLEQFKLALSAVPSNDFLMGRIAPRDGQKQFRLGLDFLLSTGSGMHDVLAGLIDKAQDPANGSPPGSGVPDREAEFERLYFENQAAKRAAANPAEAA